MSKTHKIFINPGHCPGIDPGAVNKTHNVEEASIDLAVGNKLAAILREHGYDVTVEQSNNLCGEDSQPWAESVIGHANNLLGTSGLFISIHCNSYVNEDAYGTEVFCHPSSVKGKRCAELVQNSICSKLGTESRSPNMEQGRHYAVCKYTTMTAILVELAFISNENDFTKLVTNQDEFAEAIADGVLKYFNN